MRDQAVAEEVAQETWLAVLQGLDRFEGRSWLKTWMFRILTNRAITRAKRERRSTPFSALAPDEGRRSTLIASCRQMTRMARALAAGLAHLE